MFSSKFLPRIGTIAIVLMLAMGSVQPALAVGANDSFVNATIIGSLPFNTTADNYGATFEPGELNPTCGYGYNPATIWYAYTPSTDMSLTARSEYWSIPPVLAIYTGSLGNLTQIACGNYYPRLAFQAQAGVTYYFQLSGLYDWYQGAIPFWLEVTPPPNVNFYYSPWDPSMYDTISFNPQINDPGGIYGDTYAWSFGDGSTSNESYPQHRYTTDGDYLSSLTFTTYDGRSNTTNTTVQVRTRDVAITKFSIPQTAKSNTTKAINVDVSNKCYSEYVQVVLYKGLPGGGEQQIGALNIYVPARATRPTTFKFSYTFTPADATIGKVTFRAVATIASGRDALPADNTAIGTTLVNGSTGPISYP